MAKIKIDTKVIDEKLVAAISEDLRSKEIPCVLWGNYLLTVYGVPSIIDSIDFIIPDELLHTAVLALQHTGLAGCTLPSSCTAVAKSRSSPPLAAHFHTDSEITVSLCEKSTTLWFLPSFALSIDSPDKAPDIILASDPRLPPKRFGRGHGAFQAGLSPVYIPSAHRLLEAYIRLIARTHGGSYEYFWMAMLTYIEEYVDQDGLLDEANLEESCHIFYRGLKTGSKPVATLLQELQGTFPR